MSFRVDGVALTLVTNVPREAVGLPTQRWETNQARKIECYKHI